ncbi:hypothetical protein [Nonomuraea dietziae]|uniref:hypothetical protein n=1 Tax=Nonomuraea dietziae TaxID=65515 RepID=UPI00342B2038
MRRLVLAWAAAALTATVAGVAVLGLLGGSLAGTESRTMSDADVRAALSAATSAPPTGPAPENPGPAPTGSPPASPGPSPAGPGQESPGAGQVRAFRTSGGTVVAACDRGLVRLRSWSPAQGYTTDDVDTEPDDHVTVEFESEASEVEVVLRCDAQGRPLMTSRR